MRERLGDFFWAGAPVRWEPIPTFAWQLDSGFGAHPDDLALVADGLRAAFDGC